MCVVRKSSAVWALPLSTPVANLQAHDVYRGKVQTVFGYRAEPVPLENSCAVHIGATLEVRAPVGCAPAGSLIVLSGDIAPTGEVIPQATERTNATGITSLTFVAR